MSEPVAVLGVGQTTYVRRHPESSAADLIWAAAEEALADAGLGIDAVEFCPWALREGVILRRLDILES